MTAAAPQLRPDATAFVLVEPLDLAATLWPVAHGTGDRTIRIGRGEAWRASLTPFGRGRRIGDGMGAGRRLGGFAGGRAGGRR
jgi:hypothetical protein